MSNYEELFAKPYDPQSLDGLLKGFDEWSNSLLPRSPPPLARSGVAHRSKSEPIIPTVVSEVQPESSSEAQPTSSLNSGSSLSTIINFITDHPGGIGEAIHATNIGPTTLPSTSTTDPAAQFFKDYPIFSSLIDHIIGTTISMWLNYDNNISWPNGDPASGESAQLDDIIERAINLILKCNAVDGSRPVEQGMQFPFCFTHKLIPNYRCTP
jgi:hypothetical protein